MTCKVVLEMRFLPPQTLCSLLLPLHQTPSRIPAQAAKAGERVERPAPLTSVISTGAPPDCCLPRESLARSGEIPTLLSLQRRSGEFSPSSVPGLSLADVGSAWSAQYRENTPYRHGKGLITPDLSTPRPRFRKGKISLFALRSR